jgi:hypothetical protein
MDVSPILLQCPSAKESTKKFQYYREMISAYLPDLSFPKIPTIPKLGLGELPQIESLLPFSNSTILFPSVPNVPMLAAVQQSFLNHVNGIVTSLWGETEPENRKRAHEDEQLNQNKRREVEKDGKIEKEANEETELFETPNMIQQSETFPRVIKKPFSQKEKAKNPKKESVKLSDATNDAKSTVFTHFTKLVADGADLEDQQEFRNNVEYFGDQLTKELVNIGEITEAKLVSGDSPSQPTPGLKFPRFDYYVSSNTIDTVVHQYFLGLGAHFSYWKDKDIMFFCLEKILNNKS